MKDLKDLYSEAARRSKIRPKNFERSATAMWELLSEQPLPIQYRLISQALDYQQKVNPNAISNRSEPSPKKAMSKSRASDNRGSGGVVENHERKRWYWYLCPTSWFR